LSTVEIAQQQARLRSSVTAALEKAAALGASQAEADASYGEGLSVTVRQQDVETLEYHRDQGLEVTVYFGQRKGSASTTDMRAESIDQTVAKACSLAGYAAEDAAAGLADADRMATEFPDLDLYHHWELDADQAIVLATECEAAALACDKRITNSEGASLSRHEGCRVYGNSHGFLAGYPDTQHSLSCSVLASNGNEMQRDYEYTVARDPGALVSPVTIGQQAARGAVERLGARKLDTRVTPVIYPAKLARGLFGSALSALSGGALYRRASFLLDSLDTEIFAPHITLTESPYLPRAAGSAPFDNEGVATQQREIVSSGVLRGYVLASYYARKLGLESTGNAGGVHNLLVSDTGVSYADLIEQMGTGFIVTEMMGQGVNPVNGDYSRGAAGFWVENGEIAFPVQEVTLGGNLLEMYRGMVAIATDIDRRGSICSGSVLIDRMTLAGS
jgi:PmbA protein